MGKKLHSLRDYSNIFLIQGKFDIAEKQLKEILDIYEKLRKNQPQSNLLEYIEAKNTLANLYRCANRKDDALTQLQESINAMKVVVEQDAAPFKTLYFHNREILGLLKFDVGGTEIENGIKILEEIYPHSEYLPNRGIDYFGVLANFFLNHQMLEQALLWADRILKVDTNNLWATRIIAQVLLFRQEYSTLLEKVNILISNQAMDIEHLLDLNDFDELCFLKAAALYSLNRIEEADQICNLGLKKNKINIFLFITKIRILIQRGLVNDAKDLTSRFLNYFPNHPFGLEMLKKLNEQNKPK